jgi:hypothetical protein
MWDRLCGLVVRVSGYRYRGPGFDSHHQEHIQLYLQHLIFVPQNILSKNTDPEYYGKEVKRLKVKVRKMHNKRNFGQPYQAELERLSEELLVANKKVQEKCLLSVLQNEG